MHFTKALSFFAVLGFCSVLNAAPVNINTAPAAEIAKALKGVGISKAEAIVAYREHKGGFKQASDIVQVKGIGKATFEKNRQDILIK